MTPAAVTVRNALHTVLDGVALNRRQARALYNPDAEPNSLVEHVIALRHHGVPTAVIRGLLDQILAVLRLNAQEGGCETDLAGQLDDLAAALHDGECNDPLHQALGVKTLARNLRGPLADLADPASDGVKYFKACGAIKDVIGLATPQQLRGASLRHELGAGPHNRLLSLLEVVDGAPA